MKNKKRTALLSLALIFSVLIHYAGVKHNAFLASILSADSLRVENKDPDYVVNLTKYMGRRYVTKKRAVQALFSFFDVDLDFSGEKDARQYFSDIKKEDFFNNYLARICKDDILPCGEKRFYPNKPIQVTDFLKIFYAFSGEKETIQKKYRDFGGDENTPYIKEAVLTGLLPEKEDFSKKLTVNRGRNILKRYKILKLYGNDIKKYFYGLEYNEKNITRENYKRLTEVLAVIENYNSIIKAKKDKMPEENLIRLEKAKNKFVSLKNDFIENPSLLEKDFPDEVKEKIKKYSIQEVLGKISYDFSTNPPYRQRNLTKSLSKFNNLILQPNDNLNYWEVISPSYETDYEYGWIISGDREVWAYAGGLCGTSSIIFNAAWLGGMEAVERAPHSTLFASLYPTVGIDATVVKKGRNLKIKNTTGYPALIYLDINEKNKKLDFYILGTNPYKDIKYEGPIKTGGRKKVTIKWKRIFEKFDGTKKEDVLKSYYREIKGRL